jgi:chromatin segregation and condensation protein Rec8/ScpA/Scc1 (kleisin family)
MSAITFDHHTAFTWQLRLPTFEGPLDVLLRLIEKQQLPITDVSLALVSDQFLQAARELDGSAPETIAEFTAVGSRLVAIKARSLIPRSPAQGNQGSGETVRPDRQARHGGVLSERRSDRSAR